MGQPPTPSLKSFIESSLEHSAIWPRHIEIFHPLQDHRVVSCPDDQLPLKTITSREVTALGRILQLGDRAARLFCLSQFWFRCTHILRTPTALALRSQPIRL
jgi:hypothetical protein